MILLPVEQRFIGFHTLHERIRITNILRQHKSVNNFKDIGDCVRASCLTAMLIDGEVVEMSDIVYLYSVDETYSWLGY